jgi:hypothetical protein
MPILRVWEQQGGGWSRFDRLYVYLFGAEML